MDKSFKGSNGNSVFEGFDVDDIDDVFDICGTQHVKKKL